MCECIIVLCCVNQTNGMGGGGNIKGWAFISQNSYSELNLFFYYFESHFVYNYDINRNLFYQTNRPFFSFFDLFYFKEESYWDPLRN